MGLPGLYGHVKKHPDMFHERHLRDTKLVIDGLGLLRHLYEGLESKFGGEYPQYHQNCTLFFDNLQRCGITAYIVFDGAWDLDDKKFKTLLKRHKEKLHVAQAVSKERRYHGQRMLIPAFALRILQDMARDRSDVFAVTADFEADDEIVGLANHFKCPVLALDNDFFVYPLQGGYIPFPNLEWKNPEMLILDQESAKRPRKEYLSCSVFDSQDELCKTLGIKKDQLALLATIRGNDYMERDSLKAFHESVKVPYGGKGYDVLGKWIAKHHDKNADDILGEVLDIMKLSGEKRQEVENQAKLSIKMYSSTPESRLVEFFHGKTDVSPTSLEKASTSAATTTPLESASASGQSQKESTDTYEKLGLPSQMVQHIRAGKLHSMWVNVFVRREFIGLKQVENFHRTSANDISKDIRAILYGVILGKETKSVKEYDRESRSSRVMEKSVDIPQELENYGTLPVLDAIDEMSKEERKKLLLASLHQTESVSQEDLQLPMAVTRYWYQKLKSRQFINSIVRGLVVGFLMYPDESMVKVFNKYLKDLPNAIIDVLHPFAEWQSCLLYANDLNVLLNEPLPKFDMAKMFSGRQTQQLVELVNDKGGTFNKILDEFPSFKEKYLELWNYVKCK
ncbi:single-strand DNA endonuclease ASTE1-like [Amphiura filiformis]|uniref:single-strand DNA endonuclease ASTE1-like n=1 Tax=Amphiura filiformis TaxID=82378 RepID=UPI003B226219